MSQLVNVDVRVQDGVHSTDQSVRSKCYRELVLELLEGDQLDVLSRPRADEDRRHVYVDRFIIVVELPSILRSMVTPERLANDETILVDGVVVTMFDGSVRHR